MITTTTRITSLTRIAAVAAAGLVLAAAGVYPQLAARLTGDEIRLRVAPVDPIDPFRGAYVALDYPDLRRVGSPGLPDGRAGDVFVVLRQDGEVWVADSWTRERPESGVYLACDDRSWNLRCGIESWFLPQEDAAAMEREVGDGAVATVKVTGRGYATVVDVEG